MNVTVSILNSSLTQQKISNVINKLVYLPSIVTHGNPISTLEAPSNNLGFSDAIVIGHCGPGQFKNFYHFKYCPIKVMVVCDVATIHPMLVAQGHSFPEGVDDLRCFKERCSGSYWNDSTKSLPLLWLMTYTIIDPSSVTHCPTPYEGQNCAFSPENFHQRIVS